MCIYQIEFDKITYSNLQKSIDTYYIGRERSSTKNYFKYHGRFYPIMNIVKIAIEYNDDIANDQLYDNLSCCKNTLCRLLDKQITFYKLYEDEL